jgi:hypothetical protein
MWTIIHGVDSATRSSHPIDHSLVNLSQSSFGQQAASHSRLIGYDQNLQWTPGENGQGLERVRKEFKLLPGLDEVRSI